MNSLSAAVQTRSPAHIDFSPPMGGGSHGKLGGGHDVCGVVVGSGCDGTGSYCGSPGRHPTNGPRSSPHLMLPDNPHLHHHHQVPQTMSPGAIGITPSASASAYPLSGILSTSANNLSPQPYQTYYSHKKQDAQRVAAKNAGGAIISDIINNSAGYGEVPYFALDGGARAAVNSTVSGATGAGSAPAVSRMSTVSNKKYKGSRSVEVEICSDARGSYRTDAPSSTAAKYQQAWGFEAQDQDQTSAFFGSSPIRTQYAAVTPPSRDTAALAVGSRTMAAVGRLPATLGADSGASSLSSLTPPFSPFLSGIPSGGIGGGRGGTGVGGSKSTLSPNPGLEMTQFSLDLSSIANRSNSDGRTEAGFAGYGMGYERNDLSKRASEQSKPPAPFSLSRNSSNRNTGNERALTPAEKLERNRIRNRDHSRKSRQRKKALVEGMKKQVSELGAYRVLVEQAHDLISAHTMDDRALFLFASEAFQRLLGINPQELIGAQFLHVVHQDDTVKVSDAIRSALLYKEVVQVRYRLRHHSRGEFMVETSFRMVRTRLLAVTRVNGPSPSAEGARR